jgi:F420-dependent oxidoreductase-like protein
MKLGYSLGYGDIAHPDEVVAVVEAAERLGYDSVWTAEAYGADALTPLAWCGAATSRLRLGTAVMQLSARAPTATAMAAMTMDQLSRGRFVLGLGVSGPQVVEGWYGQPFSQPLARTREYVEIIRKVVERQAPVGYQGRHYTLPYPGGTGLGKPLKPIIHPLRPRMPIMLAAEGPKNVALAAEIADGWIPFWISPKSDAYYRAALAEGFSRRAAQSVPPEFEVIAPVPVTVAASIEEAADEVRPMLALYIGGMGTRGTNFHLNVLARLGWHDQCEQVQERYLAGDRAAAAAAIPTAMVEDVALIGPESKIRQDLAAWRSTCITTLVAVARPALLEIIRRLIPE